MRSQIAANPAMVPDLNLGDISRENMIVVTAHRRENFGGGLQQICEAIASLARSRRDVEIVYPVHLNPNVKGPVHQLLGGLSNVHLLPPLDYVSFVSLIVSPSTLIVTVLVVWPAANAM